jgi:RNA polymerase sigma-70 factor (family 1)
LLVSPDEIYNEHLILSRVANGDDEAFAILMRKYGNNLYSQALAYTKSSEVAQDIVQDVFLKVWTKRSDLPGIERFDNYLFIMARNRIISIMRKKLTFPVSDSMQELISENSPSSELRLSLKQAEIILEKGISLMPPKRQLVFRLSRRDELSYAEISEQLNISTSTVKGHIVQALNFLRDYFRTHGDSLIVLILMICSG